MSIGELTLVVTRAAHRMPETQGLHFVMPHGALLGFKFDKCVVKYDVITGPLFMDWLNGVSVLHTAGTDPFPIQYETKKQSLGLDAYGRTQEQHDAAKAKRFSQWMRGHEHYVKNAQPRLLSMRERACRDLAIYKPMERGNWATSPFRGIVEHLTHLISEINAYDKGMGDPDNLHIGDVAAHSKQMYDYLDANGMR